MFSDVLGRTQDTTSTFLRQMNEKYPDIVQHGGILQLETTFNKILDSHISWTHNNTFIDNGSLSQCLHSCHSLYTNTTSEEFTTDNLKFDIQNESRSESIYRHRVKRSIDVEESDIDKAKAAAFFLPDKYSIEEKVAKSLHKVSIIIVIVLLTQTGFKVFCFGEHFLDNKLEVWYTYNS